LNQPSRKRRRPVSKRILFGAEEQIFSVLPASIQVNFRNESSENALLWNLIYPLAQPNVALGDLLALRPLWGTHKSNGGETDGLKPYFWGYAIDGERLVELDPVLLALDSTGPRTEVDLFLVGQKNLILVEAKNQSGLGRCSRYSQGRCPEIHSHQDSEERSCQYWDVSNTSFESELHFGPRPEEGQGPPACYRHYQLARTLLVGKTLATRMGLLFHLWLVLPKANWPSIEPTWLDFVDRVRRDDLWRRMRVLSWDDVQRIGVR
jgi:hypothetical protein